MKLKSWLLTVALIMLVNQHSHADLYLSVSSNGDVREATNTENTVVSYSNGILDRIDNNWVVAAEGYGEDYDGTSLLGGSQVNDSGESDLVSIELSTDNGPGSLTFELVQTDMTGTFDGFSFSLDGTTLGSGTTIDVAYYASDANTSTFTEDDLLGRQEGVTPEDGKLFVNMSESVFVSEPYSIAMVVTVHHSGIGVTYFNANMVHTPEPASLAMLTLGGVLAGFGLRRRRRHQTSPDSAA